MGLAAQPVLRGRVVDSAGRPLPRVEVFDVGRIHTETDSAGGFRVPLSQPKTILQLRRIGLRPLALTVAARTLDLDTTLVLEAVPLHLEELTTQAASAPFRFNLIPSFAIDDSTFGLTGYYAAGGAALSDAGDALALDLRSGRGRALAYRTWRFQGREIWAKGTGEVTCDGVVGRPLAGQFVSGGPDLIASMTDSGQVFNNVPIGRGRRSSCRPVFTLPNGWRPEAAAGTLGRWYVVVRDTLGSRQIAAISDHGRVEWLLPLGQWVPSRAAGSLQIAARGPLVTIAAAAFPFSWVVLDSAGTIVLGGSPIADAEAWATEPVLTDGWEAAALLPLEVGYAQSVQTRDGRRRITVAYDGRGRVARVDRSGSAPLLIATALHTRRLLGVRTSWTRRGRLFEFGY